MNKEKNIQTINVQRTKDLNMIRVVRQLVCLQGFIQAEGRSMEAEDSLGAVEFYPFLFRESYGLANVNVRSNRIVYVVSAKLHEALELEKCQRIVVKEVYNEVTRLAYNKFIENKFVPVDPSLDIFRDALLNYIRHTPEFELSSERFFKYFCEYLSYDY